MTYISILGDKNQSIYQDLCTVCPSKRGVVWVNTGTCGESHPQIQHKLSISSMETWHNRVVCEALKDLVDTQSHTYLGPVWFKQEWILGSLEISFPNFGSHTAWPLNCHVTSWHIRRPIPVGDQQQTYKMRKKVLPKFLKQSGPHSAVSVVALPLCLTIGFTRTGLRL